MQSVQIWELTLASFRMTLDGHGGVKSLERLVGRFIKKGWHAYQKASASEHAKEIKARFHDPEALADVDALVGVRDFLAHRFLRVRCGQGGFENDATLELLHYAVRFMQSQKRLATAQSGIGGGGGAESIPDYLQVFAAAVGRSVINAEPLELALKKAMAAERRT